MQKQDQYLDFLFDPSFQGVKRLFVLSFADGTHRTSHSRYFLPTVEIKDFKFITSLTIMFNDATF